MKDCNKSVSSAKMCTIDGRVVIAVAIGILLLPNIIFLLAWVDKKYAIGIVMLCIYSYWTFLKKIQRLKMPRIIVKKILLVEIMIAAGIIIWLSGIGGYWPQYYDWIVRNPIYRDLIFESWPVIYESTGRALCYYIGFWLPPAVVTKVFGKIFDVNEIVLWNVGNFFLFIWAVICLFMIFLMVLLYTQKKEIVGRAEWRKTLLIFAGFGGAAALGFIFSAFFGYISYNVYDSILIEHWSGVIAIANSNYIILSNVFNQGIYAWIATLIFLFLCEEYNWYGLIAFSLFLSAPFPTVGLGILMIGKLIEFVIKKKFSIKRLISFSNISMLFLAIVVALYFLGQDGSHFYFKNFAEILGIGKAIAGYILTLLLTYGIYSLVVWKKNKNFFFIWLNLSIAILFCFTINGTMDFASRTIIPAYFIIMLYVIQYINEDFVFINKKNILLIGMICFSYITILVSILQNVRVIMDNRTLFVPYDSPEVYTFSDKKDEEDYELIDQYTKCIVLKNDIFFDYLCENKVKDNPVVFIIEDCEPKLEKVYMASSMVDQVLEIVNEQDRVKALNYMEKSFQEEDCYKEIEFDTPIRINKVRNYDIFSTEATIYCPLSHKVIDKGEKYGIDLWITNEGEQPIYSCELVDNAWVQIGALLEDGNGTIYETNIGRTNIDEIIWPGQSVRIPFEISLENVEKNEVFDTEDLYVKFCWVYTERNDGDYIETFANFSNASSYQIKIK